MTSRRISLVVLAAAMMIPLSGKGLRAADTATPAPPATTPPKSPAPRTGSGTKLHRPAPEPKGDALRVQDVYTEDKVDIPAGFFADGKKAVPAGAYKVILMKTEYPQQRADYFFELRRPGSDEVAGKVSGVKISVLPPGKAMQLMGFAGRKRGTTHVGGKMSGLNALGAKGHSHNVADGEEAEEPAGQDDQAAKAEESANKGDKPAPKHEQRKPIVANVVENTMRIAYREKTDSATPQVRLYYIEAALQEPPKPVKPVKPAAPAETAPPKKG